MIRRKDFLTINYWKSNYKVKSEHNMKRLIEFYKSILSQGHRDLKYIEHHHMVPRCMNYDEIIDSENIIELTPKEHFIVHLILSKCFEGRENGCMNTALFRMCYKNKYNHREFISARIYDKIRTQMALAKSDLYIYEDFECYGSRNMRDYLKSIGYEKISQLTVQKLSNMMPVNGYEELIGKVLKIDRNTGEITDISKVNLSCKKPRYHPDLTGKYCVTNGEVNKHIDPSELGYYESIGWWRGNKKRQLSKESAEKMNPKGRMWIHNSESTKLIYPDELETYIQKGYIKGRK